MPPPRPLLSMQSPPLPLVLLPQFPPLLQGPGSGTGVQVESKLLGRRCN